MTPDVNALARYAVSCKGWKWLPGMAFFDEHGAQWRVQSETHATLVHDDRVPDLTDPATLGCLTALVRQAWGDSRLVVIYCEPAHPGQSEGWAVQTADNRLPVAGENYESEAEALVCALEAAP